MRRVIAFIFSAAVFVVIFFALFPSSLSITQWSFTHSFPLFWKVFSIIGDLCCSFYIATLIFRDILSR